MKKKSFTYILILVVAVVWFQVFSRIKGTWFGEEVIENNNIRITNAITPLPKDTFELNANYRDPFQGGEFKSEVKDSTAQKSKSVEFKLKPIPKPVYWPKIKYYGIVKKTESTKPLAIVNVDGIQLMLRKGEEIFGDMKLTFISRDSIVVMNKKEKRMFWR